MEKLEYLSAVIEGVVHPVMVLNSNHQIIAINSEAADLFDINKTNKNSITFGQLFHCNNALNLGHCGTTIFCNRCPINQTLLKILESHGVVKNQTAIIARNESGNHQLWRIGFSAKFLDLSENAALITIHTLIKDEKKPLKIEFNNIKIEAAIEPSPDHELNKDFINLGLPRVESCLNGLFEKSDNGLLMVDEECRILKWNKRLIDIFGFTDDDITEAIDVTSVLSFSSFRTDSETENNWKDIIQNNQNYVSLEGYIKNRQGFQVPVHFQLVPLINGESQSQGVLIILRDLSETFTAKNKAEISYFALEHSPFEFFLIEPSGKIQYANKLARKILGLGTDLIENINISDINPSSSDDWWIKHYQKLEETGIAQFETSHWNALGFTYPVVVNMSLIKQNDQKLICYFSYDNTEQHKIQETLLKESRINESLAEISNELSLHNSLGSVALLVRQYALEITNSIFCFIVYKDPFSNQLVTSIYSDSSENYKPQVLQIESIIKQDNNELNNEKEELRDRFSHILNDSSESQIGGVSFFDLIPFTNAAWTGVFFHEKYKGLLFVAGKSTDYSSVDIVHLKNLANLFAVAINRIQEQVKLINNMEQLELALDVSNMGVWNIYPEKNKLVIDKRSDKLLFSSGLSDETDIREFKHLFHPEDLKKVNQAFNEHLISNSSFFRSAIRIKNKRKEYIWYDINGRIVSRSPSGQITRVTGVVMDINKMMKLNEELVLSREEALLASQAKGAFLARISHEIRTPLNAIIGFSDYLLNQINDPVQMDYLYNIKNSGEKLVALLTDVLDYAKIESGMMQLNIKPIIFRDLINEIYKMFAYSAEQKLLDLRIEISETLPKVVLLDEIQLRQILINLIGNAIKFTEKGYIELIIKEQNKKNTEFDMIISVIDTGIGIKPESQIKIFEDFTQQEDQDNRKYGGTGLGLGIVKKLVDLMGGTIKLSSFPLQGSHFLIELPKIPISDNQYLEKPEANSFNKNNAQFVKKEANNTTINDECKKTCVANLKDEWEQFSKRPSFKDLPDIVNKIKAIATQYKDKTLVIFSQRMEKSSASFDVEELKKIISDFEYYTGIKK